MQLIRAVGTGLPSRYMRYAVVAAVLLGSAMWIWLDHMQTAQAAERAAAEARWKKAMAGEVCTGGRIASARAITQTAVGFRQPVAN